MYIIELMCNYMKHEQKLYDKIIDSCICEENEIEDTCKKLHDLYHVVECQYNAYHKMCNDNLSCLIYAVPKKGEFENCIFRAKAVSDEYTNKILSCSKIAELNDRRSKKG